MTHAVADNRIPEDWVPVEQRIAGIDRRTIAPALVVLAIALIWAVVLPVIDRADSPNSPTERATSSTWARAS